MLEARFWEHVETDTPPPADGIASADKALRQLYPGGGDTLDFSEDRRLSGAFAELVTLRRELDAKEGQAELLKQTLQQAMGEGARAVFASGEVTYRRAKDGIRLDTRRLTADHAALIAAYTVPKPGARRFVIVD